MHIKAKRSIYFGIGAALLMTACVPALPIVKEDLLTIPGEFPITKPTPDTNPDSDIDPDSYTDAENKEHDAQKNIPEVPSQTATISWKDFFTEPQLSSMIEIGLKNNQELHIIEQEIYIANNEVLARQGEYLPKMGIRTGYGFDKVGQYTSQGASDAANQVPQYLQTGTVGLTTTWEIDVFSKLRNASKAAYFGYLSSIEGKKFAVTRLVAEIAHVYFDLLALDNQLEIINSYVEVLKQIKAMVVLQKNAARVTALPVTRFEAEVLKNESRQSQLQQQITMTQNKLNALMGRFPQSLTRDPKQFLNFNLATIDTGIPSSLLENRPDIKAATFELESSKLSVKSAKARFYPSLSIDAGVGFESFNASHFLNYPASFFYGVGGNLTAPLLNRQGIKAAYFSANNKQIQAAYRYEQTLVNAYTEVVNQLNMIKNLTRVYDLKSKQVRTLKRSTEISNILFQAARVDYIEALLTQRDALEAQVELIEIKKDLLSAHINLYKALGGGWRDDHKKPAKE